MNMERLRLWQSRLGRNDSSYSDWYKRMDERERLYQGSRRINPIVDKARKSNSETPHVRNICSELIEAQVDSNIPSPKVTAVYQEDEALAKVIEDMLRNELERLPFHQINDLMERIVPIQGGGAYLVEWDNSARTHTTIGDLSVSAIHPKQLVPQDGVYSGIEDMDYVILKIPQTKEYIYRRYGVDVSNESEEEPDVKGIDGTTADDMITQYIAYYRNDAGGIGLYSWVGNYELEDLEDYQARRLRRCAVCGELEPTADDGDMEQHALEEEDDAASKALEDAQILSAEDMTVAAMTAEELELDTAAIEAADAAMGGPGLPPDRPDWNGSMRWIDGELWPDENTSGNEPDEGRDVKRCPYCGSTQWVDSIEDYEEIWTPITTSHGNRIPGAREEMYLTGEVDPLTGLPIPAVRLVPTRIPYYKPNVYPVVLQKNVSVYGQLLGDSDIDKIQDQQNTTNRLEKKIIDKLVSSGSFVTLPIDARIGVDENDMRVYRPPTPASANMINVYNLEGDVSQDREYLDHVYEEAREIIGITDSFQGRKDSTATSGTAKEFAAAQTAGRLESKRIMRDAAYSQLFRLMFLFKLAYADEPRAVLSIDSRGLPHYEQFDRYDFLKRDAAGEWYWNDAFLFSCDTSAPLASNREAMWQETRMNLQTGAFGDPANIKTLILFWQKMNLLHYPGAGETLAYLENELAEQQKMQQIQLQMQAQQAAAQQAAQLTQEVVNAAESGAQIGGGAM